MRKQIAVAGLGIVALAALSWSRAGSLQHHEENAAAHQVCLLNVEKMTCSGCEAAVRNAAEKVDGVREAKVSYRKGTAEVTYDPAKTTPEAIAKAITEKSGFKAQVPQRGKK